jgi:tetratricopeptide (TPR) repeat protein
MRWFEQGAEFLPSPLREVIQDKLERNDLLPDLRKYSLITEGKNGFGVHRLLQEVIRESLGAEQGQWVDYCVSVLHANRDFDFSMPEKLAEFSVLAPHIEAATSWKEKAERKEIADLYVFLGRGYKEFAQYSNALDLYFKALDIRRKVLGKEHLDTATTYNGIAGVYKNQHDYEKALEWYFKALAIKKKVLSKEHPSMATTYNNIATVYYRQGKYEKALKWYFKALAIKEKVLSKEHPSTATTYNNIAWVYYNQGEYAKALSEFLKAYCIRVRTFSEANPRTTACRSNMEIAYQKTANPKPFLEWLAEAMRCPIADDPCAP